MENINYLVFSVADKDIALDIAAVITIEQYMEPFAYERTSDNLLGYIRLRGEAIPVFSVRNKLDMEEVGGTSETKLLVVNIREQSIALKIDHMKEIVESRMYSIYDMPSILMNEKTNFIEGIIHKDNKLIFILDYLKLLSEEEFEESIKLIDEINSKNNEGVNGKSEEEQDEENK